MKRITLASIILLLLFVNAVPVQAEMYSYDFHRITYCSYYDLSDQLGVDVSDAGNEQALFTFYNDIGIRSSICDIYFDDNSGSLLSLADIFNEPGVNFDTPANPANLPGGHPFSFYANFSADSDPPVKHNGIDSASESLGLLFNLTDGKSFSDLINALENSDLRIGLHVQAIGDCCCDASDSYINNPGEPPVVPVPGAFILGMLGMTFAGVKLRKLT
jgi:hypothetical protein